jgi:hypothetical protein
MSPFYFGHRFERVAPMWLRGMRWDCDQTGRADGCTRHRVFGNISGLYRSNKHLVKSATLDTSVKLTPTAG